MEPAETSPGTPPTRARPPFALLWWALLAAVTSLPYVRARTLDVPGTLPDVQLGFEVDTNAYLAYVRQAADGAWLFHAPYTAEPHEPVFFNLEWLVAGKLAALCGGSLAAAFHLQRLGALALLCWAVASLARRLFAGAPARRLALAWTTMAGGLGVLLRVPALQGPLGRVRFLDLTAGVHPFSWALLQPHFLLAQALALAALELALRADERASPRAALGAGLLVAAAGSSRPFDLLVLWTALGAFALVRAIQQRGGLHALLRRCLPIAVSAPVLAYQVWLFRVHPVFRWWGLQNDLPPPAPADLVAGLGLGGPLLVLGAVALLRPAQRRPAPLLVTLQALAALALLHAYPLFTFALQFLPALSVPATLAGLHALRGPLERGLARPLGRAAWLALLVASSTSSALLLGAALERVGAGRHRLDAEVVAAYRWLDEHAAERDVVVAPFADSNRLPRFAHVTSYCGYSFGTVRYAEKLERLERFLAGPASPSARRALLREADARWVLFTRGSPSFDPDTLPELRVRLRNGSAVVCEVVPEPP